MGTSSELKVRRHFAWFPIYCQGSLVWLWFYWGLLNDEGVETVYFPYDPREE